MGVPCFARGLDDLAQRQGGLPETAHPVCPLLGVPLQEPCKSAGMGQAGRGAPGSCVVAHDHVDELRGVRPKHVFLLGQTPRATDAAAGGVWPKATLAGYRSQSYA